MNRYYINTMGDSVILLRWKNDSDYIFNSKMKVLEMKECTIYEYYIFKYLRFNFRAKDKTKWLRNFILSKLKAIFNG